MERFDIENIHWEITDDFEGSDGWYGLNSGDILVDGSPWGHFLARWRPNSIDGIKIILTAVSEGGDAKLSVCASLVAGDPFTIKPLPSCESIWEADGVVFGEIVDPQDYNTFGRAIKAIELIPLIVESDVILRKNLILSTQIVCEVGEFRFTKD